MIGSFSFLFKYVQFADGFARCFWCVCVIQLFFCFGLFCLNYVPLDSSSPCIRTIFVVLDRGSTLSLPPWFPNELPRQENKWDIFTYKCCKYCYYFMANKSINHRNIFLVHSGSDIAQVPLNRHLFSIHSLDLLVILLSSIRCQI